MLHEWMNFSLLNKACPTSRSLPFCSEHSVPGWGRRSRAGLLSPDSLGALGKLTLFYCSLPHPESQGQMLFGTLTPLGVHIPKGFPFILWPSMLSHPPQSPGDHFGECPLSQNFVDGPKKCHVQVIPLLCVNCPRIFTQGFCRMGPHGHP